MRDKIFDRLFAEAEIAKFTKRELHEYEDSLKAYRDIKNSIDSAEEKGRVKGRAEGRAEGRDERSVEIARTMLSVGEDIDKISLYTGLTKEQILELKTHC